MCLCSGFPGYQKNKRKCASVEIMFHSFWVLHTSHVNERWVSICCLWYIYFQPSKYIDDGSVFFINAADYLMHFE